MDYLEEKLKERLEGIDGDIPRIEEIGRRMKRM